MSNYICQTFSVKTLQLLEYNAFIKITRITKNDIPNDCKSFLGHEDCAFFISKFLGKEPPYEENHNTLTLSDNDVLYVVTGLKLSKKKDKDMTVEQLEKHYDCFKVTAKGFTIQVESVFKRLIHDKIIVAERYLTHHLKLTYLNVNHLQEAELKVTRVTKKEIELNNTKTYIANDNQRKAVEKYLDTTINGTYQTFNLKSGDVIYIVTTDLGREEDKYGKNHSIEWYDEHNVYLKIDVEGLNVGVELQG